MPSKYDPDVLAMAVRPVLTYLDDYPSQWAAVKAVWMRWG